MEIREKRKFFNSRKQLAKFLKKSGFESQEPFERIICKGNSYDTTSCEYIKEIIM